MLLNTHSHFSLRYGLLSSVELLQKLSQGSGVQQHFRISIILMLRWILFVSPGNMAFAHCWGWFSKRDEPAVCRHCPKQFRFLRTESTPGCPYTHSSAFRSGFYKPAYFCDPSLSQSLHLTDRFCITKMHLLNFQWINWVYCAINMCAWHHISM